jgi:2-polyprenyl-6-hydroxyphenyl methylase/3-demethylubiquinone-9 3-methyltransferase
VACGRPALARYASLPLSVRLHTRFRAFTCPLDVVAARLPDRGRLLDVGCGHGLFCHEAALRRPGLEIVGLDPSPEKIRWAEASAAGAAGVRFRCGRVETLDENGFDVVAVLDVLYLVPRADWPAFLGACRDRLRPGGLFLLKEVSPRPRWKFYRCVLQEFLSVRLLGITLGGSFAFAEPAEMTVVLDRAGLARVTVTDLGRGYLTPHVLYEAVRP